jgi:hypothetical protein
MKDKRRSIIGERRTVTRTLDQYSAEDARSSVQLAAQPLAHDSTY